MSARPRVLLLGARGRVGAEVARALAPWTALVTAGRGPQDDVALDLLAPGSGAAALESAAPAVVVNAAGYVDVDRAEAEPEQARLLNAVAPEALARACTAQGALLVHVGTDYVFDGALGRPYREEDEPRPLSVYGRTKWEGEQAVLAAGGAHLVLRTAWVHARGRPGWLSTFEQRLRGAGPMAAVADQRGSPTWARSFAQALDGMLRRLRGIGPAGDLDPQAVGGLYHVAGAGGASWHEIACALRDLLGLATEVRPVPRAAFAQAAPRPPDSRLENARLARVFGLVLPPWREALAACLAAPATAPR